MFWYICPHASAISYIKCSSLDIMTCSIYQASVNHHELVQETRRCIQTFQKLKSQEAVPTARRLEDKTWFEDKTWEQEVQNLELIVFSGSPVKGWMVSWGWQWWRRQVLLPQCRKHWYLFILSLLKTEWFPESDPTWNTWNGSSLAETPIVFCLQVGWLLDFPSSGRLKNKLSNCCCYWYCVDIL